MPNCVNMPTFDFQLEGCVQCKDRKTCKNVTHVTIMKTCEKSRYCFGRSFLCKKPKTFLVFGKNKKDFMCIDDDSFLYNGTWYKCSALRYDMKRMIEKGVENGTIKFGKG